MNISKRQKRHRRIRKGIKGTPEKLRVCVYKSNKHLQIQLVDDSNVSKTVLGMSTKVLEGKDSKLTKTEKADALGKLFVEKYFSLDKTNKSKNEVIFDRGGYRYHGRIKALAESLRSNGFKF